MSGGHDEAPRRRGDPPPPRNLQADAGDARRPTPDRRRDLERIREGLRVAGTILRRYAEAGFTVQRKQRNDPVTEADLEVDRALRELLPEPGDGWLSEETADDASRLRAHRVWVVDPLDGTREFVEGIPEWCVSIGLVEDGTPVAGGLFNPARDEMVLGALGAGIELNGAPARVSAREGVDGAVVLASRSEVKRGEWARFADGPFDVRATGSVAYKLGCVAAGLCDATWTLVPKSEWDVAAGVALVHAAGGAARLPDRSLPRFNQPRPLLPGLLAANPKLLAAIFTHLNGAG